MADEVNFTPSWDNEAEQCKMCASYQENDGKKACVPEGKTFEEAVEEYGEVSPSGHCNFFAAK